MLKNILAINEDFIDKCWKYYIDNGIIHFVEDIASKKFIKKYVL